MSIFKRFRKFIQNAQKIVITTHIHPDADGIGSQIALFYALKKLGKDIIPVLERPLSKRYFHLDTEKVIIPHSELVKKRHEFKNIDLLIVVDTNSLSRIGTNMQEVMKKSKNLLFIDHHPAPKEVLALHCIDTKMAATGELIGRMIEDLNISFSKEIALALYTAILIDTSSFRYPTVTGNTHDLISKLLSTGLNSSLAYNQIYRTKNENYLKFLGTTLSKVKTTLNGKIAWIEIEEKLLKKFKVNKEDVYAFINQLLVLENIKVACMFIQEKNFVKISLRSFGNNIDVGKMAQALGGGGHNHSAATVVEGEIKEIVRSTIDKIKIMIEDIEDET